MNLIVALELFTHHFALDAVMGAGVIDLLVDGVMGVLLCSLRQT